jgi:hypothetical protein
MSGPETGQRGPNGARKAQKIPENGAQMSQDGVGIQGDRGNESGNKSVIS